MKSISILGGGHQGLAMAGHLALKGNECYLWNRSEKNVREIIETKRIICKGVVSGIAKVCGVTTNIAENLQKLIMVTTPSTAHIDIARQLASIVDESYTIILNPGRTFGALEFIRVLTEYGCKSLPLVAETQTIVYTCRRSDFNEVEIYALKDRIPIAAITENDTQKIMERLPECLKVHFFPADSYIRTSMGNVGMILHCAPVLMNIGWIENEKVDFKYYYEGISPTIAKLLEKLDSERLAVASAMGTEIESLSVWLERTYNTNGKNLYERLQNNQYYKSIDAPLTIYHRYIEEDVPNGLVPLESAGKYYKIATPIATLVIDLANVVMETDYRKIGRKFIDSAK